MQQYDKIIKITQRRLTMDVIAKINEYIDNKRDDFLNDLSSLVAIKSVKSEAKEGMPFGEGCAECMEKCMNIFASYGLKCENLGNYIGYCDLNENQTALDILGHIDVVGEGDGWDSDPYTMLLKDDGCVYGRGTDDDKGPVVAALYAMRAIKDLNIPLSKNVRLIVGGDEESGSELDLNAYYSKFSPAPATFSPDASFPIFNTEKGSYKPTFTKKIATSTILPRVAEFSGGYRINVLPAKAQVKILGLSKNDISQITNEYSKKSGVIFSANDTNEGVIIYADGKATHASTPEDGLNGITALLNLIALFNLPSCPVNDAVKELSELFPFGDNYGKAININQEDEISKKLTVVLSLLEITENSVWGRFDARTPLCANDDNCRCHFEKIMNEKHYFTEGEMSPPHHTPEDSVFVSTLKSVYESFTGEKCKCLSMGGGTYVHNIEGGVAFGASKPDFQSNLHGANERACVDDLLAAAKIFAHVIVQMCK